MDIYSALLILAPLVIDKVGTYALQNGMSVVKWEASNPAANRVSICMNCIGYEKCIINTDKTILVPPSPAGCSSPYNVKIFESAPSESVF